MQDFRNLQCIQVGNEMARPVVTYSDHEITSDNRQQILSISKDQFYMM